MPSHAAGKEQGRNSDLQLFSQFLAVSAGGLGSGKVSFEQILTLLALQFPPGALVTAGGVEGGWMKKNLMTFPFRKPACRLLGKGGFLAPLESLSALSQPLRRVAHPGLSVLGGLEWR